LDATYTIVVSNNGPFGVQNARISDPLPAGITSAQWTCGNETGGAQCGQASGTGSIDTTANPPVNGSVTYVLSMGVPSSFTGSLTNTATVTAPDGSPDINLANNTASDTNTMEQPPVSGACSPRPVQPSNQWATTGGDFSWTVNFNQPVPAEWIEFSLIDVNGTTEGAPYNPVIQVTATGAATTADFRQKSGNLAYSPATGRLTYTGTPFRQSATLVGNSPNLVTSIQISAAGLHSGDYIVVSLAARAPCLTVAKISEGQTGSFQFNMVNVVAENGSGVPSTTLTTTEQGVQVTSPQYYSADTRTNLLLAEVVPEGWNAASAVCTDRNAGTTDRKSTRL